MKAQEATFHKFKTAEITGNPPTMTSMAYDLKVGNFQEDTQMPWTYLAHCQSPCTWLQQPLGKVCLLLFIFSTTLWGPPIVKKVWYLLARETRKWSFRAMSHFQYEEGFKRWGRINTNYLHYCHFFKKIIKQQKGIASQFCRSNIWNQGVGRVTSFWGLWERICSSSHSLLDIVGVLWLVKVSP